MKTLVTGGAGFVGSHLVRRLLELGDDVVVLDSLDEQVHTTAPLVPDEVRFVKGDVGDRGAATEALRGVQKTFPGELHTATIVVEAADVNAPDVQAAVSALRERAAATVVQRGSIDTDVNSAKTAETITVPLAGNGSDAASESGVTRLRKDIVPATLGILTDVEYGVTGGTAIDMDGRSAMKTSAPLVFAFVLFFAFALLLVSFRSLVIAAKAVILNLLSVAAAYGVLVLVFQHGWGKGLIGFDYTGGVISFLPIFMFVILFSGLALYTRSANSKDVHAPTMEVDDAAPAAPRPRRVAMLVDSLKVGGAERIAVEVACALDRTRFEPFVVVTRFSGPLAAPLEEAGVEYAIIDRKRGFAPWKYWRAHRLVKTADLIHAHKYGSNMWGALLARTTNRPLVAREPTFSGVRETRRTYGYRSWIAPVASRIICPSGIVAQSLYDEGVPEHLVEVVPNGVRTDAALPRLVARRELGLPPDAFVAGIIAQLRVEKAHEVLLQAAARLRAEGRSLKICVIGDGARRPILQDVARRLGLDGSVVWAGEQRDARRLAAALDVGVICSDWEGLPVASLEILAAGVPLVATAVGTLPAIVGDDAGLIVGVRDDEGLARAIAALMDDPARAAALGARGRRRVLDEYGFEHMVRDFERIYTEALEEWARHPSRRKRR